MKDFKSIFKSLEKAQAIKMGALLFMGIILMLFSSKTAPEEKKEQLSKPEENNFLKESEEYDSLLEKRLKNALSNVSGVGKVEVMITLSYGREIILAEEDSTNQQITKEQTQDGGIREITNTSSDNKIVLKKEQGYEEPLVLKEIKPKIEGVLIIAEGGGNPEVKKVLTQAAISLLNVDAHKVTILKMK